MVVLVPKQYFHNCNHDSYLRLPLSARWGASNVELGDVAVMLEFPLEGAV